jgi:ATP-dependent protease Clp ATPase subunit
MTEGRLEPKRCSFCGKSEQEPFNLIIIFHATPVCGICVNAMGHAMQKEQYHRTAHKARLEQAKALGYPASRWRMGL